MFRYSNASGHRASYDSYCGHWYINWPLDAAATVYFAPHNSHNRSTDVFPPSFPVRVDKYVQIPAGIVTSADGSTFKCTFSRRKQPGTWVLVYQPNGFSGAHGSRHVYNQMGGKVYEVDFLLARRLNDEEEWPARLELHLPTTEKNIPLAMLVPKIGTTKSGTRFGLLTVVIDVVVYTSRSS